MNNQVNLGVGELVLVCREQMLHTMSVIGTLTSGTHIIHLLNVEVTCSPVPKSQKHWIICFDRLVRVFYLKHLTISFPQ